MAQVSKDIMAVLLVVTIIISIFGTITAMYSMLNYKKVSEAVSPDNVGTAKVSVNLYDPNAPLSASVPVTVTGKVFVNVLPESEGG